MTASIASSANRDVVRRLPIPPSLARFACPAGRPTSRWPPTARPSASSTDRRTYGGGERLTRHTRTRTLTPRLPSRTYPPPEQQNVVLQIVVTAARGTRPRRFFGAN